MHGLRAGFQRGMNDVVDPQITLGRSRTANVNGFIADGDVLGLCVGIGIHSHAAYAQAFASRGHTARNLASIRNQDFVEHEEAREEIIALHGAALSAEASSAAVTSGTRRNACPRSAHSLTPPARVRAHRESAPGRSRRRPT